MKTTELSGLKVSTTTARFVSALELLSQTEDAFLDALSDLYGEDTGDKFFNENLAPFEAVEGVLSKYLALSVGDHLADKTEPGVI